LTFFKDCNDDVNGAINAGIPSVLVKTGKYCPGDENKLLDNSASKVFSNFSSCVNEILASLRKES